MIRTAPADDGSGRRPIDRWIPWMFVAALVVVVAVNGVMIGLAMWTWTGLATTDAYRKGIAYNRALEAAQAQAALGWRAEIGFVPAAEGGGQLTLSLVDAKGEPIERASVTGRLIRPTHAGYDTDVALPAQGGGRFVSPIQVPLPGIWDVRLMIESRGRVFQATRRITVP